MSNKDCHIQMLTKSVQYVLRKMDYTICSMLCIHCHYVELGYMALYVNMKWQI